MAGDFSRSTLNPVKHYTGVLMQQGRVLVDADWNEQLALQLHRTWVETRDVIGRCGTPKSGDGFAISSIDNGADLLIHPGHFYVNGLLCELDPQKMPAWLAPISSPPSTHRVTYRMTSGESLASVRDRLQRTQAQNSRMKIFFNDGQLYIPSLTIDNRDLAIGNRVQVTGSQGASVIAQVTAIGEATTPGDPNTIVPSWYPVTVNKSLSSLVNSGHLFLRRVVTFTTQPFLSNQWDESVEISPLSGPSAETLSLPDGDYIVVLEAWQREINALEDPHIREVALGGPDTCERLQTVWQVHILPWSGESSPPGSPLDSPLPSPPSPLDCCSDFPAYDDYRASTGTTGLMNAQAPPPGNNVPPCQLPPSAGYLGLANQLYRVEIFRSGRYNEDATFVWSRDNSMVETPIVCLDSSGNVYVSSLGNDDLHSFALNDWVEIIDDDAALEGKPRFLAQISQAPGAAAQPPCASAGTQAYSLTLVPTPAGFENRTNLRLRRWDMPSGVVALDASLNPIGIPIVSGWIQLENNIQVNFSDGHYATRSYWQIPARTATGDIEWPPFAVPNTNPIPQPPLGPDHSFCRLALLTVTGGKINIDDCRCTFPSLTSICADDICCETAGCELLPVSTVQDALDELDAKRRLHNRTLHGAGVVCGLAVTCPGGNLAGTNVNVADGYAIDCEGYDLILNQTSSVDLSTLIDLSPQQSAIPDGEYELIIERVFPNLHLGPLHSPLPEPSKDPCCSKTSAAINSANQCVNFRVIPCETERISKEYLDGTLLMDFYTRCLKPLVDDVKTEYANKYLSADNQVSEGQALLSALTNLVIQYAQPTLARDVYISAVEAKLLENFYSFITRHLKDSTDCSLLAGLRKFPGYPLDAPIHTIFGKGYKTRLRINPNGKFAVACGNGPDLHIYDLSTGLLVADITPPIPGTPAAWTLQDVAFTTDGAQIYIIATGVNTQTNANDSFFAVGRFSGKTITWTKQGSAGAQAYRTLAVISPQPSTVFATAQGTGIYFIEFANAITATQMAQFNAIGHLVANGELLYATAISGNIYEVQRYAARAAGGLQPNMVLQPKGLTIDQTDDLAVGRFNEATGASIGAAVFVSGSSAASANKQVALFNNKRQIGAVDLGINTTIRMALRPSAEALIVSFESTSQLSTVVWGGNGLALARYAPVELHPTSITFGNANHTNLYTFNSTANTISTVPSSMPPFAAYAALEKYRLDALNAFIDLAGALLQSLKDCFCRLLLPNCATCSEDAPEGNGVPLACITIQNGIVDRICNLEKRRIVKSFPTVGYWLSLIPVIPLVKALVQQLCCSALSNAFTKLSVPEAAKESPVNAANRINLSSLNNLSGDNLRYALSQAGKINMSSLPSALLKKSAPLGKLSLDSVFSNFSKPSSSAPSSPIAAINGMTLDQAKAALQSANVQVAATETYNPTTLAQNLGSYVMAPSSLPVGSSVTLMVDSNNVVRYYLPTALAVQQLDKTVQANQTFVESQIKSANEVTQQLEKRVAAIDTVKAPPARSSQSLQNLVNSLQSQVANMQSSQTSALVQRDQQIAELVATTQQLQARLRAVDTLTTQVQSIEGRLPAASRTTTAKKKSTRKSNPTS